MKLMAFRLIPLVAVHGTLMDEDRRAIFPVLTAASCKPEYAQAVRELL
ncbi:hypothetical protein ACOJBM_15425 [Rhizobium beringeri]|jgi:hypothetical protein|nr:MULTISPECIES: hypothetical protein [Rhizobium]UIJ81721.1 hypothetical protein LZK78_10735 [Rhizobium leguminosarum]WSG76127.1 hypothetical protein U8P80_11305 [Rhizobium beringeri]WSG90935.1 hypothetical protein U8P73_11055 [Rhizobium beringeri]WSH16322.1 hypothetical protein U8P74_11305 [Rhizobium beringeri]WSH29045.1 hypothetical protein U8P75_11035 [Rhizobium beringeri]